jgi:hypothetical protein
MALDQTRANEILTHMHSNSSTPALSTPIHVRLMVTNGNATTPGTEVATGGGYTSGVGAPTVTWAAAASGSQATNAAVNVTNYPRVETVNGIEIWDSYATPRRIEYGAISGGGKLMAIGDTLSFASGAITSALA